MLKLFLIALALDRILHRTHQQLTVKLTFEQIILGSSLHCLERESIVIVTGEHDDRDLRRVRVHFDERFKPVIVLDQQDVIAIVHYSLAGGSVTTVNQKRSID